MIMSIELVSSPNPQWEFGDRIRKVRRNVAHMTQEQMAAAIGVTQKAYAAWESGGKPGDIVAIARRVEQLWPGRVTAAWVIGVDGESSPPTTPAAHPLFGSQEAGAQIHRLRPAASGRRARNERTLVGVEIEDVDADAVAYIALADPANDPSCPHQGSNLGPADYQTACAA